jgi:Ca-activated chloride channel family protein
VGAARVTFAAPGALWSLVLLPAAVLAYVVVQRRRMRYAVRFPNLELLASVVEQEAGRRRHVATALFLLALLCLLVGVARPQATIAAPRHDATVMLVMDVSKSMLQRDVEPNRLEAARRAAQGFLARLPDDIRVGVIAFSDFADVAARPTTDRVAVRESIASLVPIMRTAIGDAIVAGVRVLEQDAGNGRSDSTRPTSSAERPSAAIVLLSDGSQTTGNVQPFEGARRARAAGIPVHTIALGPREASVRERAATGSRQQSYPPDHDTLRRIASASRGEYFSAPTRRRLEAIYNGLGSRFALVRERQEVTFAFAAAGLVLTAAATILSLRRKARFP